MTDISITENDARITITATGGQTVFSYDFPILDADHIVVQVKASASAAATTLTKTTDYSVSGVGAEAGGSVTLVVGATVNYIYILSRSVPEKRTTDFTQAGDFRATTVNQELDLQTMMIQEMRRDIDRAFRLSVSSVYTGAITIETVTAGYILRVKTDGLGIETVVASSLGATITTLLGVLAANDMLVYDGSAWVNKTPSQVRTALGLVIGTNVMAYDADVLFADVSDNLTVGYTATTYDAGTKSSGTYTPDPTLGNLQRAVNGGAHTLAPPTAGDCTMLLQYTNNASAGAVTTSGFTKVTGDTISTTNGDDFLFFVTKINTFSHLHVQALQ